MNKMIADGKLIASILKEQITKKLFQTGEKSVCFVIFGNDPGSRQFINMKCRFAEGLGVRTHIEEHPENVSFNDVKKIIDKILTENYSGIVVQLPLPKNLNPDDVLNLVPPEKDIDVLSQKAKDLYTGHTDKVPPVARAIEEILEFYKVDLTGKKIIIIGTGKLVGEPVGNMLKIKKLPFVQIDRSLSKEKRDEMLKTADVIISGAGDPYFIKPSMIKDGVVLIDAGTSEQNGKIVGDVDPECFKKVSLVTPVPGGVGPVTLASLFLNL